jgi:hypothetical protein
MNCTDMQEYKCGDRVNLFVSAQSCHHKTVVSAPSKPCKPCNIQRVASPFFFKRNVVRNIPELRN